MVSIAFTSFCEVPTPLNSKMGLPSSTVGGEHESDARMTGIKRIRSALMDSVFDSQLSRRRKAAYVHFMIQAILRDDTEVSIDQAPFAHMSSHPLTPFEELRTHPPVLF
jgi:hypothetical protein